jgi:hypothetical protein
MEWYAPLTVLPALGLIILSTSNFIVALNTELIDLENESAPKLAVIKAKIQQMRRLGIANVSLYVSVFLFLVAGMSNAVTSSDGVFFGIMFLAVACFSIAIFTLLIHAIKAVKIRDRHLKL